jgi:hypothetical protein
MVDLKPTIILIDTPYQERIPEKSRARSPSPHSPPDEDTENHEEELYGLALLQRIISESYLRSLSKLVLPVPIVVFPLADSPKASDSSSDVREEFANAKLHPGSPTSRRVANRRMLKKCLDLGAIDVMASPMNGKCITNLEVHAYRAHREAARDQKALLEVRRGRKRSWVGISEEKPFAYLREAMVSNLMNGICRIENENDEGPGNLRIWVSVEKQTEIAEAVGRWHFCAHSFTDDELIIAAAVMFDHALAMPELEAWRLPTGTCKMRVWAAAHECSFSALVADGLDRPTSQLCCRLPGRLQWLRALPQLSTCRGRSASHVPFPRSHRRLAPLSGCQQPARGAVDKIPNFGTSEAF